jgi:hypothetical protein
MYNGISKGNETNALKSKFLIWMRRIYDTLIAEGAQQTLSLQLMTWESVPTRNQEL